MHQGFECAEVSGVLLDTTSSPGRCSLLRTWYQLREGVRLAKAENARPLIGYANHFDSMLIHDSELAFLWYSYGRGLEKQGKTAQRRYRKLGVAEKRDELKLRFNHPAHFSSPDSATPKIISSKISFPGIVKRLDW